MSSDEARRALLHHTTIDDPDFQRFLARLLTRTFLYGILTGLLLMGVTCLVILWVRT